MDPRQVRGFLYYLIDSNGGILIQDSGSLWHLRTLFSSELM